MKSFSCGDVCIECLKNMFKFVIFCSITCVKLLYNVLVLEVSLNSPWADDYLILPRSLYRNRQKWTSAINSFETNFLSYFDIVSEVVAVSGWLGDVYWFLPWFSMFFNDIFWRFWILCVEFKTLCCNFFYDLSWANNFF